MKTLTIIWAILIIACIIEAYFCTKFENEL
jgi:hypothetical protein